MIFNPTPGLSGPACDISKMKILTLISNKKRAISAVERQFSLNYQKIMKYTLPVEELLCVETTATLSVQSLT